MSNKMKWYKVERTNHEGEKGFVVEIERNGVREQVYEWFHHRTRNAEVIVKIEMFMSNVRLRKYASTI